MREEEEKEEKVQAMREEVRDPDGWDQAIGSVGLRLYWHRRTRNAVWALPPSALIRKRKKKRKKRLPRTSSRPSRPLWRRRPSSRACLPTSGTTSSVVSRVRGRVGSCGACLPTHCVLATGFYSTEPIPHWIVLFSGSLR